MAPPRRNKVLPVRERYKIIKDGNAGLLGSGYEGDVFALKLKHVRTGKTKRIAIKHPNERSLDRRHHAQVVFHKELARNKRIMRLLAAEGIPVPKTYRPILRSQSPYYLSTIMENLKARYGKIYPINPIPGKPTPTFLARLSVKKDTALLNALARDLVVFEKIGYCLNEADAWCFYRDKKSGAWKRIVVDVGEFDQNISQLKALALFQSQLSKSAFIYFINQYRQHRKKILKNPKRRYAW